MTRFMLLSGFLLGPALAVAQMENHAGVAANKPAAKPSTELVVTGLSGASRRLLPSDFKALSHVTATVHNPHNNQDESYSGVPVKDLLAMVSVTQGSGPKVSANMQIVVASATDDFQVAITLCDTNPECRSGEAIVADSKGGEPLTTDGAFKLILTGDKKPARWARNLHALTMRSVAGQ